MAAIFDGNNFINNIRCVRFIFLSRNNGDIFMDDIVEKIKNACEQYIIYLYGAGIYGRTLYAFVQEQKIGNIEKFIVSMLDGQRNVLGKEVIALDEYVTQSIFNQKTYKEEFERKDLIIITVSKKYSTEIVRLLEERDLHNYMTITQKEWDMIERATLFNNVFPQRNIAVLMYHRIINSEYNFWKLNVSPKTFEQHIRYISENYKVLRLDEEWRDIVKADQKYVVITFDDGYVDNYQFALPILEKYHVPATIFVSTDLIDTDEMYWWDELEKIFIVDKYIGEFTFDGVLYKVTDSKCSENVCLTIRNRIKNMPPSKRRKCIRELRLALGLKQSETSVLRCMNTQELRRMAASPYVTIGGHTRSHLSMGSVHPKELLRSEIEESLSILEKKIGKKIDVFAYPFGGTEDRCDIADQILLECGIKKSLLVKDGNVNVNDRMYNMPRHMIFEHDDIEKKLNRIWGIYG